MGNKPKKPQREKVVYWKSKKTTKKGRKYFRLAHPKQKNKDRNTKTFFPRELN